MAAHGYAVLLPDPALSTGYGRAFVTRGWGRWGAAPYTDVLALTDAAERLPEIDAGRTAAMGGSFGGYLANWVAGHTDRFTAVVTHASLWALDQFVPTTDDPDYWRRELTPQVRAEYSPHRHADAIRTPMLVIHGDRDYRVPIGEALRLWSDLVARCSEPGAAQVPLLPRREPLDPAPVTRPALVRHRARVPRPPCAAGPTGWSRICCVETVVLPPDRGRPRGRCRIEAAPHDEEVAHGAERQPHRGLQGPRPGRCRDRRLPEARSTAGRRVGDGDEPQGGPRGDPAQRLHQHLRQRPAHGPRPHHGPGGPDPRARDHRRGDREGLRRPVPRGRATSARSRSTSPAGAVATAARARPGSA